MTSRRGARRGGDQDGPPPPPEDEAEAAGDPTGLQALVLQMQAQMQQLQQQLVTGQAQVQQLQQQRMADLAQIQLLQQQQAVATGNPVPPTPPRFALTPAEHKQGVLDFSNKNDAILFKESSRSLHQDPADRYSLDPAYTQAFLNRVYDRGVDANLSSLLVPEDNCLLYTSPSPRDLSTSRMPSSA